MIHTHCLEFTNSEKVQCLKSEFLSVDCIFSVSIIVLLPCRLAVGTLDRDSESG